MIKCEGLRENNLKNITVSFPENEITAVVGVSGSGKSSFAFDSVYSESQRVFFELMFPQASEMRLKHAHPALDRITPILPAISMKQAKNNFNPRSTVGTYTGISGILRTFFSAVLKENTGGNVSAAMLSPNTSAGACPVCKGLGYVATIDMDEIVDEQRSIENGGIKIWKHKSNSDYYKQLLIAVCDELGIDTTVPLGQLGKEKLEQLLEPQGEIIVTISYRTLKGGKRTKKTRFSGILHELEAYAKKHSISEILSGGYHNYFAKSTCPSCGGKRVRMEAGLAAEGSSICRILAAACFAGAAVRLYFACYFSCVLVGINKRGKEWKFAVSDTASFECWGRFLAMNVSFRDESGLTREGRSRFLFGPHEAEAWQNLPLEIAYRDDDERIVVIGAAPENAGR